MPTVEMTSHLYRFFPVLESRKIQLPAGSVAELIQAVDTIAPGFSNYVLNDQGALRRHVLVSVDKALIVDRKTLSDYVSESGTLYIFQALTGG